MTHCNPWKHCIHHIQMWKWPFDVQLSASWLLYWHPERSMCYFGQSCHKVPWNYYLVFVILLVFVRPSMYKKNVFRKYNFSTCFIPQLLKPFSKTTYRFVSKRCIEKFLKTKSLHCLCTASPMSTSVEFGSIVAVWWDRMMHAGITMNPPLNLSYHM